ncbi:MAG TPA: hypothetical protein VMH39_15480 [Gemmatimonadaceae bacterium]|nr:hypothetical protein [Gemmatimonadaceae bacterium]
MAGKKKGGREPLQVYLDIGDRALLAAMAERASLPRSEIVRTALRRYSAELLDADGPGSSLNALIDVLDESPGVPADLAARHDEYLYPPSAPRKRPKRSAPRKRSTPRTR